MYGNIWLYIKHKPYNILLTQSCDALEKNKENRTIFKSASLDYYDLLHVKLDLLLQVKRICFIDKHICSNPY